MRCGRSNFGFLFGEREDGFLAAKQQESSTMESVMRISRFVVVISFLAGIWAMAFSPAREVKTASTTKMTFKGALGTRMKMFGGNKPITRTQYIPDYKSRTDNTDEEGKLTTSTIIDMDRETFINIDDKKKEAKN
jgi:hypothetical protein